MKQIPLYDRILYETDNFIVIPTIGSLVPGYIMIVSRDHFSSMAYLSTKQMDELINLLSLLKSFIHNKLNINPIIFEHGSADGCANLSACCVDHAHLHIVPINLSEVNIILERSQLKKILNMECLTLFKGTPYVLYSDAYNNYYASQNSVFPSQYFRKWIAKETGHPYEWDWKNYEFLENVKKTLDIFYDIGNFNPKRG
jgi:diadenosine tetraphosphate (Ap4A) HIT family hydrolase